MTTTASGDVLDAIRREMTLRQVSQRQLARLLGWDHVYTHRRISGAVALTVGELHEIAAALSVPVTRFLPAAEQAGGAR
jgi:transcriptional regulator with XRE-family HTH domain